MSSGRSADDDMTELKRLQETALDDRDRLSLIHELSVYQEELAAQNEALLRAQATIEETRDRFIELYDFAPTAYLTLDRNGLILQCNLTAATLLGRAKQSIEGFPLLGYVLPRDRTKYAEFLQRCRSGHEDVEAELTLRTSDRPRVLQLVCRPRRHLGDRREFFTSLMDVTERRALEEERARVAHQHAALASRLIAAQDEERQRIARDLHDDIGQQHTAIRLRLERLAMEGGNESLGPMIAQLQEQFDRLDQRLHFIATELRPATLDLGLVEALEQFVSIWSSTFRVSAGVLSHLPPRVRFPPDVETHLYRITQEALNNVAKHAMAHNVSVLLESRDDGARLIIEDDGRGFDPDCVGANSSSLGLVGMRERAQIIGGRLDVESAPGQGTSIFVHVPAPPSR